MQIFDLPRLVLLHGVVRTGLIMGMFVTDRLSGALAAEDSCAIESQ